MKVLFGTYDECNIWAKRHGLERREWRHWAGALLGLRFKSDDIVVLGSWWDTCRPWLKPDDLDHLVRTLATRMDRGEKVPEL